MTESIYVPFRLTTPEACEKAIKVLTSEPTPWPKCEVPYEVVEMDEEGWKEFAKKIKARHEKRSENGLES